MIRWTLAGALLLTLSTGHAPAQDYVYGAAALDPVELGPAQRL